MSILLETLLSMPIHQGTKTIITTSFEWETYKYVAIGDPEDPEIVDECNEVTVTLKVPRISFLEYIDILLFYQKKDWYNNHYVTRKIAPLNEVPNGFWFYFDSKNANFLYYSAYEKKRVIGIYYIEEFSQYAAIDLEMTKSIRKATN